MIDFFKNVYFLVLKVEYFGYFVSKEPLFSVKNS